MIIQISWFVDYFPPWLPIALISLGTFLALVNTIFQYPINRYLKLGTMLFTFSLCIILIDSYGNNPTTTMLLFMCVSKYIEGFTIVNIYVKISGMKNSIDYGLDLIQKAKVHITTIFFVIASSWVIIFIILLEPFNLIFYKNLILWWTLITVFSSFGGLVIKTGKVQVKEARWMILGAILIITGSEVYNLTSLRLEIFATVLGAISHLVGYSIAGFLFLKEESRLHDYINAEFTTHRN